MGCGLGFIGCGQVGLAVAVLSLWVGVTGFGTSGAFLSLIEHAPRFDLRKSLKSSAKLNGKIHEQCKIIEFSLNSFH